MRRATLLFLLAALLIPLFTSQLLSVDLKKGKPAEPSPSPGDLSVSISLLGDRGGVYRAGKEIRFSFTTTKDAYVVVYNIDSEGYVHLLWPDDGDIVLSEGSKTVFVPSAAQGIRWETGDKTGIEYLHALAVSDRNRIKDEEVYFLAKGDEMPAEKRFRVDMDPYLAFNMIDEQVVDNAESEPPATDYTYFYINRAVEYPRYLCTKCHAPENLPDPYAVECTEVVIEKSEYEQEPHYPYPPLYDIRHAGEQAAKEETDESAARSGEDYENSKYNDDNVSLSIYYGNYDWPYYGGFSFGYYPFYWDPFWWDFGWHGYYYPWWPYYTPYYAWWYPHGYCGWHDYWWWGCDDYWYGRDYHWRPIYAQRQIVRGAVARGIANADLRRVRSLADNRSMRTRTESATRRAARSTLERRTVERTLDRRDMYPRERSVQGREVPRRVIHGENRAVPQTDRGRAVDRTRTGDRTRGIDVRRPRSPAGPEGTRTPTTPDRGARERSRESDRSTVRRVTPESRAVPQRQSPSRDRSYDSSPPRQRSSDSNRGDRGSDRKRVSGFSTATSAPRTTSRPAPQYRPPAPSVSRGSTSSHAPARGTSSPAPPSRARTR